MSEAAKRTARTVLQTAVGIALVLPAVVDASGVPAALPWVAGALAVAGGLTRVMALPGVQALLPGWLRTDAGARRDEELIALVDRERDHHPDPGTGPAGAVADGRTPGAGPAGYRRRP
ncbi:hypothetical protein SMD11_3140 [Streptomyces albireticuli]|uniref:Uncharacterized protein n=1 Tax=Streptomyces albireticuli TaxID=1940 RepID=A0A1Z2L3B1_9ACTN|nr:hypothetical protein SMD11_3140 [Streptomyces albireticuli]